MVIVTNNKFYEISEIKKKKNIAKIFRRTWCGVFITDFIRIQILNHLVDNKLIRHESIYFTKILAFFGFFVVENVLNIKIFRYLAEHHIEDYDWFMRLDDDAYISWPILEKLLRRLDPSELLYIGSPGFGKDDEDYVEEEMTYCMGGPGIVLSRELLRNLSPHLPSCLKSGTKFISRSYRNFH